MFASAVTHFGPVPVSPKSSWGYVYLIQDKKRLLCKLGCSWTPYARMRTIQRGVKGQLVLLHTIYTNSRFRLEKELHKKFRTKRISGEWFDLVDSDLLLVYAVSKVIYTDESGFSFDQLKRRYEYDWKQKQVRKKEFERNSWYPICGCVRGVPVG